MNNRPQVTPVTLRGASPAVTVAEISDPTAVGEGIDVIRQDAVQLGGKQLGARRVTVRLGSSVLVFTSTDRPIRTRTVLQKGLVAFVAFGPRAAGTVSGLPIGPDRVLASAPGIEVEFIVAAGYESAAFLLAPDNVLAHLRSRHREADLRIPAGVELLKTGLAAASDLFEWGRRLAETAARDPGVFDAPQVGSAAQVELVETLLVTLGSAVDADLARHERTRQAHGRLVKLAEDHAVAHATGDWYVTDLCQAAGVSERALQYAFREVMGMTPVAYLTRLRLHRVRQALRAAAPGSTTVTAEALKWGFWHFGDFSRAYRECFGEPPSDTLRRGQRRP